MSYFSSLLSRLRSGNLPRLLAELQWKSVLLGLATPLVFAGGYGVLKADSVDQTVLADLVTVGRRNISLSIKALGTVTLANEQQMRFNVQGKVQKVHVKVGDAVQRNALIAELDKTDPNADIRQAQLAVNDAVLRLQELQAGRNQTLLSAQNSVRDLERQLEEAHGDLPSQQMQVKDTVAQAERTVLEKEAAYKKSLRDLGVSIENAITDADSLLDDIISILSGESVIRGATRYKTFDIDFLFNDYTLKTKTEFAYYDATNAYNALREKYGSLINVEDTKKLQSALQDAIDMAQKISDFTNVSYSFLKTAVPQDSKYTDADLNALKASMNAYRSTAITLIDTLRDQQATLTQPGKNTAMQDLENARESLALLESEQKNKTTTADSAERSLSNLNDKLRVEQQKWEQTKVSVDVQINQQKNALAQKQFALEKARRALENYELRAPFDGVVRRVDFQVGDNLLADAGETKYVVLENPAYFIVTVQLDQIDVVHVKEGQKAAITFDAIPGVTFQGDIGLIDTTPIQTSGVVSYEVQIVLEPSKEYTILSGMTAKVEILTASAENAVAVPSLALSTQGNRMFVVGEDGGRIPVQTGMTDGTYTEILSGLQEGDRIQSVNVSLTATQSANQQNADSRGGLIPLGGGAFRGGSGGGGATRR
ncbi:hypothetical protein COU76_01455 [Candidatus Peregrinibacteria bacterium CG10_big_fil_rev_8_21_14_0_10_49_10]|nr:MAG: hypothetical protein COU76_01455 [Candidatus Peregrinibacteria bacterium CG10_big_fil_rev_8_21_14_0_10_49_10]